MVLSHGCRVCFGVEAVIMSDIIDVLLIWLSWRRRKRLCCFRAASAFVAFVLDSAMSRDSLAKVCVARLFFSCLLLTRYVEDLSTLMLGR